MPSHNLMIVQGGGPTAVFNTSLAEIIAEAQRQPAIRRILGSRAGIQGLLRNDIAELTSISPDDLNLLRRTPGAALGSSRYKPSEADLDTLAATLRQYEVGYMIFLGGNGTMRGAELIGSFLRASGLDISVAGVPKTIDNDLMHTDRSPGFASAARYIAASTRELGADLRALPQPVTILETMGRSVGWLAAATVLAKFNGAGAPHLICVPEIPFETDHFIDQLDRILRSDGWAVVVVAEGIVDSNGRFVYETNASSQADPLKRPMIGGVGQHLAGIVGDRLNIRCRNEKPGLLGRGSMALVSQQDLRDAALVGRAGVLALIAGERDTMVALEPLNGGHASGYRLIPLAHAAGHERPIPPEWLSPGPIPVTQEFRNYLLPLVGELDDQLMDLPRATVAESMILQ
jgi:ATP-dependent phosphofructokinase / diphosphate-dependent phosphofructokinase